MDDLGGPPLFLEIPYVSSREINTHKSKGNDFTDGPFLREPICAKQDFDLKAAKEAGEAAMKAVPWSQQDPQGAEVMKVSPQGMT